MFIGRKMELEELEKQYRKNVFHFTAVYGRRRVGKTTLIKKFLENKESVYYMAAETTAKENLELLSVQIIKVLAPGAPVNPFNSFYEALEYCFTAALKKRFILAIDEFPYLAESDRAVSSILQILIDKYQNNSRLFLILCGSSMSFMENQVLGYKSPLYGRRNTQFKILPFTYYESAEMLPSFSNEEKTILYGICGGIPEYISRIDKNLSVGKNAEDLFFNPAGRLFEEPSNLLKKELTEPQTYNGIIAAIASGASKLNEIATKTGIETSQCSNMLVTLKGLGIIKKEYPCTESKPSRKTIYRLADSMFRFWYRFVLPDYSRISMGLGRIVCSEIFGKQVSGNKIETFMGPVFEECAIQFLWREMGREKFNFKKMGRWWGSNPKEKREEEIDIMGLENDGEAMFAECKWKNRKTGNDTLDDLVRKSELFPELEKKHYMLFSKSEFTSQLAEIVKQRNDTTLIRLNDLY